MTLEEHHGAIILDAVRAAVPPDASLSVLGVDDRLSDKFRIHLVHVATFSSEPAVPLLHVLAILLGKTVVHPPAGLSEADGYQLLVVGAEARVRPIHCQAAVGQALLQGNAHPGCLCLELHDLLRDCFFFVGDLHGLILTFLRRTLHRAPHFTQDALRITRKKRTLVIPKSLPGSPRVSPRWRRPPSGRRPSPSPPPGTRPDPRRRSQPTSGPGTCLGTSG